MTEDHDVGHKGVVPLNYALLGREYPCSATVDVSRETVRRFAEAVGDRNPVCRDAGAAHDAGHPDVVAPPTFLTTLMWRFFSEGPLQDPELGLDWSKVLHGDQEFVLHRPVTAGDVLGAVVVVDVLRPTGRNELVGTLMKVTDAEGRPVAEVRSTWVSVGTAPATVRGTTDDPVNGRAFQGPVRRPFAG